MAAGWSGRRGERALFKVFGHLLTIMIYQHVWQIDVVL